MAEIASVALKVGMEVHVELATRSKMFSRAANPAHPGFDGAAPNSLIDPTVLALPGALPVTNRAAVEISMMVGMALGCEIARSTRWDRKSYFYPDLPKGYQISQYDLPLCFDGAVDVPATDEHGFVIPDAPSTRVGIVRAHLEEDAGKLLHEMPAAAAGGSQQVDFSIVDLNRAGTPLLEVVTRPDFTTSGRCVAFARMLRSICRFLGASEGVMQKGHMRFEPNINTVLRLSDGRLVHTPIVEVKNLNSFRALKEAIDFEHREQPGRWLADGREMGPGAKQTRGWDGARTTLQREKEDAHDYRYFPDPDLPAVVVSEAWRESVRARLPELPLSRLRRYVSDFGLGPPEAAALADERDDCFFYEAVIEGLVARGVERSRGGKAAANLILQSGARRANERGLPIAGLGIRPDQAAGVAALRERGDLSAAAADTLFGLLCEPGMSGADPAEVARAAGLLAVRDDATLDAWCRRAIDENPQSAADVRSGKMAAAGRLIGAVMKLSDGKADAKAARARVLELLGVSG